MADRAGWISQGKKWEDMPTSMRQVCQNDFQIPEYLAATLLPDAAISIHVLLDFLLPRPSMVAINSKDTSRFFSKYSADPMNESAILRLRHLDTPPVTVVRQLVQDRNQAWLDGFTSVKYGHLPGDGVTHFPLWVVTFWSEVIRIRLEIRKPWTATTDWLKQQMTQKKNKDVRKHATDVSRLLAILPWNGKKCGLSENGPIHELWRYLGKEWLSTTDKNDMLELLRDKIASDPELVGTVQVEAAEFTAKIVSAFEKREQLDYEALKETCWI
jgi:hypothetical protein